MPIFSKHIVSAVHEKYMNANHNRNTNFTSQDSWRLIQKTHPKTHIECTPGDVRAHRTSEIDYCIQNDLTDTAGPFLIRHHIAEGVATAKSIAHDWDFVTQPACLEGTTMHALATRWIKALDDRILPALYGASIEIDPEMVYEKGYDFLRGQFLEECDEIKLVSKKLKGSKHSAKNMAFIRQQYKRALDAFVVLLEDWALHALNDLSPWDVDAEAVD